MLLQSQQVLSNLLQRKSSVQKAVPRTHVSAKPAPAWVCKAENDSVVNGLIQVAPRAASPAPASDAKAAKAVDRSKGLWTRCEKCGVILYIKHLKEHHHICSSCNAHLKMSSQERIDHLIDRGTWRPFDETLSPVDPLQFTDQKPYTDRIKEAQTKTGLQDAIRTGTGLLHGVPVALAVMDFSYMGGSMGSVVGEKLTRLIEYATQEGLALLVVSASGGARMQEGIMSLMQMAKISAALHVHQNTAHLLYISILTSPTTGGVTASFGMLGDIILAEPQAIIGFAGRRVIEQTLQEQLPDDFQTAEYLLDHGLLDLVVPRNYMKGALFELMDLYRTAPFKRRGRVEFGVQHGLFLDTEEKVRRKLAAWRSSQSEATVVDAAAVAVEPSFSSLLASFKAVCGAGESGEYDVTAVLQDEEVLSEAMALARKGRFEYMQPTQSIEATTVPFVVRLSQPTPAGAAAADN